MTYLRRAALACLAAVAVAACSSDLSLEGTARSGAEPTATVVATPAATPTSPATPEPALDPEPGASGLGDPYYPDLGNGGYDVAWYRLDLDWDPDTGELQATAVVQAVATQDLSSFNIELHELAIDEVVVDGARAQVRRLGDEVTVTPVSPLPDGLAFEARFRYHGSPEPVLMGGLTVGGWTVDGDTVYAVGEPSGSQTWHPVNNHPLDRAMFRYEITVPGKRTVVVNAPLVERRESEGGTTTWVYETAQPQAPYLTALAIGDFVAVDEPPVGDVEIRNWFARSLQDEVDRFDATRDALATFEDLFGPYPFDAYGVLVIDASIGGALETQTLSTFGTDFFLSDAMTEVVVHELAHQWFGDHVGLAEWDDIWLNEGFATYSEYLFREQTEPGFDIDRAMARLTRLDPATVAVPPPGDPGPDQLFASSVYFRGALTLHALRRTIGDDAFFAAVRSYVDRFGGQNVVTADFVDLVETTAGRQLDDFFDSWLYQESLPALPDG